MNKRDYKIGSFKFLQAGCQFDYAQVSNKKGEVIPIFLDSRDNTWYLLQGTNTKFNVINLNRFVEDPHFQYLKEQRAKEALQEYNYNIACSSKSV